jgi:hypothetical protein
VLVLSNDDLQDYSTDIARFVGERVKTCGRWLVSLEMHGSTSGQVQSNTYDGGMTSVGYSVHDLGHTVSED